MSYPLLACLKQSHPSPDCTSVPAALEERAGLQGVAVAEVTLEGRAGTRLEPSRAGLGQAWGWVGVQVGGLGRGWGGGGPWSCCPTLPPARSRGRQEWVHTMQQGLGALRLLSGVHGDDKARGTSPAPHAGLCHHPRTVGNPPLKVQVTNQKSQHDTQNITR